MSATVAFETHFDFSALPQVIVRESFARMEGNDRAIYAGVQHTSWARDEAVWNSREGRYGGGAGFGFFRGVPGELAVEDATLETLVEAMNSTDKVARLELGNSLRASCGALYEAAASTQFRLYDSEGGFQEYLAGGPTGETRISANFGILPAGSYALWARLGIGVRGAPNSSDPELSWGEWSLLRIQIGSGAWEMAIETVASPGCPLYRKTSSLAIITPSNEANWQVMFDLAARSVSASSVLERDILRADGDVDVPRGAQLLAGLRASPNGPQSAIWMLADDGTARLLAVSENFSNGMCECGKSDHHASDIAQGPDGALYLLSECSLHRYEPDAATVSERLAPFPIARDGHPGGQCLRFPGSGQEVAFWTENLTGGVDDGASWYNRLVRRVGGRDQKSLSSWWHGPNCAETYLGRFWALRGEPNTSLSSENQRTQNATIYLDWIDNGRWHGFQGLARSAQTHRWQRLRRMGSELWIFGFAPAIQNEAGQVLVPDSPIAAWSDGKMLREVSFPFFVRRATSCEVANSSSLFLTATPALQGIGAATHVVEVHSSETKSKICSFWDADAGAFLLSRAAWEEAGHHVDDLPQFLCWQGQSGRNGGGVWLSSTVAPPEGTYLERVITATTISFIAHGEVVFSTTLILENGFALNCENGEMLDVEF